MKRVIFLFHSKGYHNVIITDIITDLTAGDRQGYLLLKLWFVFSFFCNPSLPQPCFWQDCLLEHRVGPKAVWNCKVKPFLRKLLCVLTNILTRVLGFQDGEKGVWTGWSGVFVCQSLSGAAGRLSSLGVRKHLYFEKGGKRAAIKIWDSAKPPPLKSSKSAYESAYCQTLK